MMHRKEKTTKDKLATLLDGVYYLGIVGMVILFLLYRQEPSLKWVFLIPATIALVARITARILKVKKGNNYD